MATRDAVEDRRQRCSSCSKYFKEGRRPKSLSCSHKFCDECLDQLVEKERSEARQGRRSTKRDKDAGRKDLPVSLTCPTCGARATLTPGAASHLQTNFYHDEDEREDNPRLVHKFSAITVGQRRQQSPGSFSPTQTTSDLTVGLPGDLTAQLEDLSARSTQSEKVTAGLQAENRSLRQDLVALQAKNTEMSADIPNLQKALASLMDDLKLQRRELNCVRDKNQLITLENLKLCKEINSLQSDQNKLHTDHDKLKKDHDKLQADCDKLQSDQGMPQYVYGELEVDNLVLQRHIDKLRSDLESLQLVPTRLYMEQKKVGTKIDQVQADQRQVKKDQETVRSDVSALRTDLGHIQHLVQTDKSAIVTLGTQLTRLNTHVAFHASMGNPLTVTQPQTIICDQIITNVGGGYNSQTGVFAAPVSGTYCFMASFVPDSEDVNDATVLHIVLEDQPVGSLGAWGRGRATGHCAAQVLEGQRVWVKSSHISGKTHKFRGGGTMCFTGLLH